MVSSTYYLPITNMIKVTCVRGAKDVAADDSRLITKASEPIYAAWICVPVACAVSVLCDGHRLKPTACRRVHVLLFHVWDDFPDIAALQCWLHKG